MQDSFDGLFTWLDGTPRPSARPIVTVSYAQSLDGSIAAPGGAQLSLSGPGSTRMAHRLRASHDAIMVGIGTVLADDPQLTVREVQGQNPRPVIVDTHLRTPPNARVLTAGRPPIIATRHGVEGQAAIVLQAAGAEIRHVPTAADGLLRLSELVELLDSLAVRTVMVEGGARLITSFINANLVDRVVITICPNLVGGLHATRTICRKLSGDFPRLVDPHSAVVDDDIVVWGLLASASP
jgi:riboflavin-specific deaminase-like protein